MDRLLLNYLPQVLREVPELKAVMEAEQPEIELLWNTQDDILENQFLVSATEYGVKRWERILQIYPKDTDSLETRKTRIGASWNLELPYTMRWLKSWLNTLCGPDNYTVEVDQYTLIIKVALVVKSIYHDVEALLQRICPANMHVLLLQLRNPHSTLGHYTHAQLHTHSHNQLRNEVLSE